MRAELVAIALLLAGCRPAPTWANPYPHQLPPSQAYEPSDLSPPPPPPLEPGTTSPSAPSGCCKHCRRGIPCGDSCISASKTCHISGGCACN